MLSNKRSNQLLSSRRKMLLGTTLLSATILIAGCSGAPDVGRSSCGTVCGSYGTEYDAQAGLGIVNASDLNDQGVTGSGVKVAVVDTGIDSAHSEFSGRTISGTDYTGGSSPTTDGHGHGSHVAGIIGANRDEAGMRGVAYGVDFLSYKIFNSAGTFQLVGDAGWASMVNQHFTDNVQVSNNSWGSSTAITSRTASQLSSDYPNTLQAYSDAQNSGTIFVWASGNDAAAEVSYQPGMPYYFPDMKSQWLAVISIDSTKTETSYTNRCGVAWDFCVTAPGGGDNQSADGIYSVKANGTYVRYSGTSMAAPHVSGLVALLIEQFPALTPAQVVTRLKSTASYDGLTGWYGCTSSTCSVAQMRAIFGHGLVNQQAATSSIGSLNYATSTNLFTGSNVNISAAKLALPGGISGASVAAINSAEFKVFDSFDGATFSVPGSEVFSSSSTDVAGSIGYSTSSPTNATQGERFHSLAVLSDGTGTLPAMYMSETAAPINVASLSVWGDKASMMPTPSFIKSQSASRFEIVSGIDTNLKIIPYIQMNKIDDKIDSGGFGMNVVYDMTPDTRLVASLGRADTTFDFDAYGSSVGQAAVLDSLELGFSQRLNSSWEMFGRIAQGYTSGFQATSRNWGLEGASFSRATVGLEYKASSGASIAFGMVNPGSFDSGTLSLITASGRQTNGTINWTQQSFDAASSATFVPFFAAKIPVKLNPGTDGLVMLSLQQSTGNTLGIEKADLSFSVRF